MYEPRKNIDYKILVRERIENEKLFNKMVFKIRVIYKNTVI